MGTPPRPGSTALGFLLFLVQLHVQKCSEQPLAMEGTPGPWGPQPCPALHTVLVLQGQPPPSQGRCPQSCPSTYRTGRAPAQRIGPPRPGCPGVTLRFPPGGSGHRRGPRRDTVPTLPPSVAPSEHGLCRRAHGSPCAPTAGPPVRSAWRPLSRARAALLRWSRGMPAAPLRVAAWAGAHLEPTDAEAAHRPGRPRGPVCDLAAHASPGAPAAQVQVLELPSKTSVSCLKPEAGARLGMPMCLQLWQAESSSRPLLLAGYEDGSLVLWDVSTRKVCSRVACHSEPVMGLALDPRRARGVSGSAEKALAVWSLEGQQALQVRGTHELTNPGIADVKIRPDSKILATAGWDHRVRVFQWRTMRPLAVLAFHSATVHCVAFDTAGLLAAGSGDQRISIWSLYPPT
ncbi:guanine nucleotide-binding protein subunit beta-like protein 1 isoform X3 [Dama dama]|uniref:guanine nucleotide-binding protein subunit beta-like protein 1 isoform X3 n=1 Tax=Dama dama TaxID=30532 RepID=UPI002A361FDC|nr:guanine nucleotide-binding protein subunit beta-like protein 1 isoform X3 [Dama dama]